jgi:hypothetical protein
VFGKARHRASRLLNQDVRDVLRLLGKPGELGGATALSDDASALTLGRSTPNALLLTVREREFETGDAYRTLGADVLRLIGGVFVLWVKHGGVEALACA